MATNNPLAAIERLAVQGFALLPDLLGEDDAARLRSEVWLRFPTPADYYSRSGDDVEHFRTQKHAAFVEFPFHSLRLNEVPFDDRVVDVARRVLGVDDVRLFKANLWVKYGGGVDHEQPLHLDYGNHTLAVPTRVEDRPEQVVLIIYLTDVGIEDGPTYVVPHPVAKLPAALARAPREEYAWLYEHEMPVVARAGGALVYFTSTWHRGSALNGRRASRVVLTVGYQRADVSWGGFQCFPRLAKEGAMTQILSLLSPRQRTILGLPPPGHSFWTDHTVDWMAARYPEMDVAPYANGTDLNSTG